jgi:DegV family protein with EDD domain
LLPQIKLFTDSTCDLNKSLLEEYQIGVVPLHVIFEDQSYQDGVDLTSEQLFRMVEQGGKLPKTAAPAPGEFQAAFAPFVEQGFDVLYVGLSSELSSTFQNALIAASQFPEGRVVCVDSRNLATGVGLLVMKAAEAIREGKSLQDIESMLIEARDRVETEFVIDTLDYLHKGGRCSALQSFIGGLLKIRPVVKVDDGGLILASKIRGKREKAMEQLLQNVLDQKDRLEEDLIFVEHAMAPEEAEQLKERLLQLTGVKRVIVAEAGCVISSHCGPQTVGVIYSTK